MLGTVMVLPYLISIMFLFNFNEYICKLHVLSSAFNSSSLVKNAWNSEVAVNYTVFIVSSCCNI